MTETTADELREVVENLLAMLDDGQAAQRRAAGPRPRMLDITRLAAIGDLADEHKATAVALLRQAAKHEAESSTTARAAAVAGAMEPETLGHLNSLLGALGVRSAATPTPTVTQFLSDTYTAEKQLREDAHRHVAGYILLFARVLKDRPLADYKRADVIKWVRVLEKLRTSYGKRKGDDVKTIATLIQESRGGKTINVTTIEKHITHLRAFFISANRHFKWCSRDDIDDLFHEIKLSDFVPDARPRKSWTPDQLNDLFTTPIWAGTRSRRDAVANRHEPGPQLHADAYWWLPIAALWTGMRLSELTQLQHDDLAIDKDGIHYIRVRDDGDDRHLKTSHSRRNVPVHRFLRELGFVDLFNPAKKGRIWPELKLHGRPPTWSGLYSIHFTEYRRACGIYEPLRDFHSFRRTFVTTLRTRANVDALTVAAIVGHDDSDPELKRVRMTDDYTDYSIQSLAEAVEKLDYQACGVETDHLIRTVKAAGIRGSCRVQDLTPTAI